MKSKLIVALAVLGLTHLQVYGVKQGVRAYKLEERSSKWCVIIAEPDAAADAEIAQDLSTNASKAVAKPEKHRIISEAKFKANTDYLVRKLKFDFNEQNNYTNRVLVYTNPDCAGHPRLSLIYKTNFDDNDVKELSIDLYGYAELVKEGKEPSKQKLKAKDKYKVKVKKTDPEAHSKKWTIKAVTQMNEPMSEVSIKKDTSGFSRDLEIAIEGITHVKVYNDKGRLLKMTPVRGDRAKTLLTIDANGTAELVEDFSSNVRK